MAEQREALAAREREPRLGTRPPAASAGHRDALRGSQGWFIPATDRVPLPASRRTDDLNNHLTNADERERPRSPLTVFSKFSHMRFDDHAGDVFGDLGGVAPVNVARRPSLSAGGVPDRAPDRDLSAQTHHRQHRQFFNLDTLHAFDEPTSLTSAYEVPLSTPLAARLSAPLLVPSAHHGLQNGADDDFAVASGQWFLPDNEWSTAGRHLLPGSCSATDHGVRRASAWRAYRDQLASANLPGVDIWNGGLQHIDSHCCNENRTKAVADQGGCFLNAALRSP